MCRVSTKDGRVGFYLHLFHSNSPARPGILLWGGRPDDAIVEEENYAWPPPAKGEIVGCPHFVRTVTRVTRIAAGGTLVEIRQKEGEPEKRTQRALRANEMIYISNIQGVPKLRETSARIRGDSTVDGHACRLLVLPSLVPGAASAELCVYVAPADCPHARYLQPLSMSMQGPDGATVWTGRTTLLSVGAHGQVIPAGSIRAP